MTEGGFAPALCIVAVVLVAEKRALQTNETNNTRETESFCLWCAFEGTLMPSSLTVRRDFLPVVTQRKAAAQKQQQGTNNRSTVR